MELNIGTFATVLAEDGEASESAKPRLLVAGCLLSHNQRFLIACLKLICRLYLIACLIGRLLCWLPFDHMPDQTLYLSKYLHRHIFNILKIYQQIA